MNDTVIGSLSAREEQCLVLCVKGSTAAETAKELGISQRTVENYLARLKLKFACENKMKLVIKLLGIPKYKQYASSSSKVPRTPLTKGQIECLRLCALGKTAKVSAKILGVTRRTVEGRIARAKDKFGCRKKSDLLVKLKTDDAYRSLLGLDSVTKEGVAAAANQTKEERQKQYRDDVEAQLESVAA